MLRRSRKPEIMADAAHVILNRPARECTGQFFIDDAVLYEAGVRDFDAYSVEPGRDAVRATCSSTGPLPVPPGVTVEFCVRQCHEHAAGRQPPHRAGAPPAGRAQRRRTSAWRSTPVPAAGPGQLLLRTRYLSLDPYMRGRMNEVPVVRRRRWRSVR